MTPQLAMIQIAAKIATIEKALRDAKADEATHETLAFLAGMMFKMMHVMAHIDDDAMARGIAAAEHCDNQNQGAPTTVH